jgi:hypothetical protein
MDNKINEAKLIISELNDLIERNKSIEMVENNEKSKSLTENVCEEIGETNV